MSFQNSTSENCVIQKIFFSKKECADVYKEDVHHWKKKFCNTFSIFQKHKPHKSVSVMCPKLILVNWSIKCFHYASLESINHHGRTKYYRTQIEFSFCGRMIHTHTFTHLPTFHVNKCNSEGWEHTSQTSLKHSSGITVDKLKKKRLILNYLIHNVEKRNLIWPSFGLLDIHSLIFCWRLWLLQLRAHPRLDLT